jgi:hypothetical protein
MTRLPIRKRTPSSILLDIIPSLEALLSNCASDLTDSEAAEVLHALIDQYDVLVLLCDKGEELDPSDPERSRVSDLPGL